MRADADGESPEGSWIVREEWILGGTAAVCILSMSGCGGQAHLRTWSKAAGLSLIQGCRV